MKPNSMKVLLTFIALALIGALAASAAYDISSYNDHGKSGTWIDTIAMTIDENTAIFNFKLAQKLNLTTDQFSFQAQLPSYLNALPLAESSCKIEVKGATGAPKVIPGVSIEPFWAKNATDTRYLQCQVGAVTAANAIILPTDKVQVTFVGVEYSNENNWYPECSASIFDLKPPAPLPFPELPFAPFGWKDSLFNMDSRSCCADAFLQLFKQKTVLDRAFPDQCSVTEVPECGDDCPGPNVHFTSLFFSAESHLTATKTGIKATFRTALLLNAISPKTGITANGEDIPGYVWVRLPRFRATNEDVIGLGGLSGHQEAEDMGIGCTVSHITPSGSSKRHPPTKFTASPQTLLRPINISDQAEGVIIQCALSLDIPPGSLVQVDIEGLFTPPNENSCTRFGPDAFSAHCCNGYGVEYRQGNALGSPLQGVALGANRCPNFFENEENLVVAKSRIANRLQFEPILVLPAQTVKFARYRFFVEELPTGFSTAAPSFHFFVQGFNLTTYDTLVPSTLPGWELYRTFPDPILVATATSQFNATQVLARTTLNGGLEIALLGVTTLVPGEYVTVFLPTLLATTKLPNLSTCRGAHNGVPTLDATCCNGFRLEIRVGGVSVFTYSEQCPVLPLPAPGSPPIFTSAVCNNPALFSAPGCCLQSQTFIENLSHAAQAKCYEYRCSDPTSKLFSEALCCSNEIYRHNAVCCSGAWFCPNHCCGNLRPAFTDDLTGVEIPESVGFFNQEMCCLPAPGVTDPQTDADYQFTFAGSNQHQICTCYSHMDKEEWKEFAELECCDTDRAYVEPGGIAALPPVCACDELYKDLAPVAPPAGSNSTDPVPLTIPQQQVVLVDWMVQYPALTPAYCCAWRDVEIFEDEAKNLDQYCECRDAPTPIPENLRDCCQFTGIGTKPGCGPGTGGPVICPPIEACNCGCDAPEACNGTCEAQGCVNKKKQVVEINDLKSGADTIIQIAGADEL